MKIAVVGTMGIGAAHAIALHSLGYTNFTFVDLPGRLDEIKARFEAPVWTNHWEDIRDEIRVAPSSRAYLGTYDFLRISEQFDYVVLATPPEVQLEILSKMRRTNDKQIIVAEKPWLYPSSKLRFGVLPCLEWSAHSLMDDVSDLLEDALVKEQPFSITYQHTGSHLLTDPTLDLLPHLLSLLPYRLIDPRIEISLLINEVDFRKYRWKLRFGQQESTFYTTVGYREDTGGILVTASQQKLLLKWEDMQHPDGDLFRKFHQATIGFATDSIDILNMSFSMFSTMFELCERAANIMECD